MLPFLAACWEDRPPDGHFGRVVGFLQANDIVVGSTQPGIDVGRVQDRDQGRNRLSRTVAAHVS